jgi:hypothetical protein
MTDRTRRQIISLGAGAAACVAGRQARAEILSKSAVGYQDVPSGGHVCAACVYFIFAPMVDGAIASRCKLVAGPINPAGWCEIWSPKA